jgi:hypothetical protein
MHIRYIFARVVEEVMRKPQKVYTMNEGMYMHAYMHAYVHTYIVAIMAEITRTMRVDCDYNDRESTTMDSPCGNMRCR